MGSANSHGAPHSQKSFYRSGFALLLQLAFRSQPIITIVAGVASPIQIKFVSAMRDLFRIRIAFAVGALLVLIFGMFHILSFLFLDVLSRFNALWPPVHRSNIPADRNVDAVRSHNPELAETPQCIPVIV